MDRLAPAALTLIDGDRSIPIRPPNPSAADPIFCRSWDLGAPEVRITSTPRPGTDGVDEDGGYLGSRTVTMDLRIRGDSATNQLGHDPYWYIDALTGMCHPSRRPVLKIERDSENAAGVAQYLALRGNPWSLTYERASAGIIDLQLTFTAPGGLFESELWTVVSGDATGVDATDWHFPARFPKGFGATSGTPTVALTVKGSSSVNPILYVNGPAKNPHLRDEGGQQFRLDGLTLVSGQTLQIDMGAGTVLVSDPLTGFSDTSADVFHTVDFEDSTFWLWQPGTHRVDLLSNSGSFAVQWRDRFLSI
jgi:tail protein